MKEGQIKIHSLYGLTLNNFKSFGPNCFIGPFLNISMVLGPNGAGKSNVLEAFDFALLRKNPSTNLINNSQS